MTTMFGTIVIVTNIPPSSLYAEKRISATSDGTSDMSGDINISNGKEFFFQRLVVSRRG